jgi:hypothetical protein
MLLSDRDTPRRWRSEEPASTSAAYRRGYAEGLTDHERSDGRHPANGGRPPAPLASA